MLAELLVQMQMRASPDETHGVLNYFGVKNFMINLGVYVSVKKNIMPINI